MNPSNRKTILITVDVEDWFQVENLRPAFPIGKWDACELRIESSTHTLLDLFEECGVQATFFCLGWIAERRPGLIREISARGHEVASHGYSHELTYCLSKNSLLEDLYKSKTILEALIGKEVTGYRSPNFSISKHVVDLLEKLEYRYDSSQNDFAMNRRYGKVNDLFKHSESGEWQSKNGVVELPLSNLHFGPFNVPMAGGGYFRFWPSFLFESGVNRILQRGGPYIFYCHPWEFDPLQPRATGIGALSRFRHYLNLDKTVDRLNRFLNKFQDCNFTTCSKYLGLHDRLNVS